MILCDIGNSFYHFYERGRIWKVPAVQKPDLPEGKKLFVVSVNQSAFDRLRKIKPNLIDLSNYLEFNTIYVGLGIDRAFVCYAANDGVIVDAGSAITVDIMSNGIHLGGFILPGIASLRKAYAQSAGVLDKNFNFAIDLNVFAQNTADAISYGAIGSIVLMIQNVTKNKKIYFTGGDGAYLSRFFEDSAVDEMLIFKGMFKVIEQNNF